MKNIFLTSAIIAVMSYPAIALDGNDHIQPSPTNDCVESTLGTATGPANLEADWTANTINLEWYNEDTKLTVPTTSNTCRYDGQITLPSTNPTKTGYTFRGWQVRVAQCSLSGLDTSIKSTWDAQHTRWKPMNGDSGYTMQSAYGTENSSDLANGEWAVTFSYGTIKGIATCDAPNMYCACQVTGFDAETDGSYCSVASRIFEVGELGTDYTCEGECPADCALGIQDFSGYRAVAFGQVM